jgi:hypothetical protein
VPARRVPQELSWRAARRLRYATVVVLGVAGVLLIRLVFTSAATGTTPTSPIAATQTAPTPSSSERVLLAGSALYSYDVASRRLQALPVPDTTPTALLSLLALRGGTVVLTPRGQAYVAAFGEPLHTVGTGATDAVLPDHDGDSVWLMTSGAAQLADVHGMSIGPPYAIPVGERVFAALDSGLVLAPADAKQQGLIEVVDPRSRRVVRTVTSRGIALSAAADHVAWSGCATSACPTEVTTVSSGDTAALPALPAGYLPAGSAVLSPDNRHYAIPARQLVQFAATTTDLVVGRFNGGERDVGGRIAVRQLAAASHPIAYARDGTLIVETVQGLTALAPRTFRGGQRLPVLPAFASFAVY